MVRRALFLAATALLAGSGLWLANREPALPPVTEAEARAYVDRMVVAARGHDFEGLCRLNGAAPNCRAQLDTVGPDSAPTDPPTVVGTRYLPKDGGTVAGRVVAVEGLDANGKRYHGEVFVFRTSRSSFKAVNAVFWMNSRMAAPDGP
jgi:hypothetical protein